MNHFSEPLIEGSFTVFSDELTVEVVGTQSGPGGSIGASIAENVEVELDGADPTQLNTVRLWRDGDLSPEQHRVLTMLFGSEASLIVEASRSNRPTRVGARSVRASSRSQGVRSGFAEFVQALDALDRVATPQAVQDLLRLIAVVQGSGFAHSHPLPSPEQLSLAAAGLSEDGYALWSEMIAAAVEVGVLDRKEMQRTLSSRPLPYSTSAAQPDGISELVLRSQALLNQAVWSSVSPSTTNEDVLRPLLQVDPSSIFFTNTAATWGPGSNVIVTVFGVSEPRSQLWVRARFDSDGSIVAAAPLQPNGGSLIATLLVPERDHIVLDVVPHPADRVLTQDVGALGRAFELGRRAGRLERLGRAPEAEGLWRECAAAHALTGDFQRQKMALNRALLRQPVRPATLIDHVL
jgi:hypothetical protein